MKTTQKTKAPTKLNFAQLIKFIKENEIDFFDFDDYEYLDIGDAEIVNHFIESGYNDNALNGVVVHFKEHNIYIACETDPHEGNSEYYEVVPEQGIIYNPKKQASKNPTKK